MIKKKPAKKNSRTVKKTGIPTWVAFCCGVVVTVFGQLLYHLAQVDVTSDKKLASTEIPEKAAIEEQVRPKPKITFYNELKKMEVGVNDGVDATKGVANEVSSKVTESLSNMKTQVENLKEQVQKTESKVESEKITETKQDNIRHFSLQTGSFKNTAEADEQRAQILMLGLNAEISSSMENGKTTHRVIVGPFTNAKELESAKKSLSELNMVAITVSK